jgi:hypothetical protein
LQIRQKFRRARRRSRAWRWRASAVGVRAKRRTNQKGMKSVQRPGLRVRENHQRSIESRGV